MDSGSVCRWGDQWEAMMKKQPSGCIEVVDSARGRLESKLGSRQGSLASNSTVWSSEDSAVVHNL